MKIEILQISQTTSEASAEKHKLLIDKPLNENGSDNGVTGEQLFLMSLGGDLMSHLLEEIQQNKVKARGVKINVDALGFRKLQRFTQVTLEISAEYQDKGLFKNCISKAIRKSVVFNSIGDLVKIHVKVL